MLFRSELCIDGLYVCGMPFLSTIDTTIRYRTAQWVPSRTLKSYTEVLANVIRRNEPVATDELYSDTPAIDCGATRCQVFVGMNTDVVDIY